MNCLKMCRHKKSIGFRCVAVLFLAVCLSSAEGQLVARKAEDVLPPKVRVKAFPYSKVKGVTYDACLTCMLIFMSN